MKQSSPAGERSFALFLLGVVLFNPPLLGLFRAEGLVFGLPPLYLYLFVAWALMIVLLALAIGRRRPAEAPANEGDGPQRHA